MQYHIRYLKEFRILATAIGTIGDRLHQYAQMYDSILEDVTKEIRELARKRLGTLDDMQTASRSPAQRAEYEQLINIYGQRNRRMYVAFYGYAMNKQLVSELIANGRTRSSSVARNLSTSRGRCQRFATRCRLLNKKNTLVCFHQSILDKLEAGKEKKLLCCCK